MPLPSFLALSHDLLMPLAIASVIVLFSLISFSVWTTRIGRARQAIQQLEQQLSQPHANAHDALRSAVQATSDAELQFLLRETQAGLIDLPPAQTPAQTPAATETAFNITETTSPPASHSSYSFRSHADTWTVRSVLGGRLNLALFETMPNLLIGFGLMCTFVFLAIALHQAGLALNAMDVSARQQDQALQSLIATAGGKFITSIAGLLCSLLWNWRAKVALENLQASIDTLCHTLRAQMPDNAAEASMRMQLSLFQDILLENRSQAAQLKRFGNDFADAIGGTLSAHMKPAFDKLAQLADSLQTSTQSFGNAGNAAASEFSKAGAVMTQGIEKGLLTFHEAVQNMTQTIQTTRSTVGELDAALTRITQAGHEGTQQLNTVLGQFGEVMTSVQKVMSQLQDTLGNITQTAESFKQSASSIEGSVALQQTTAQDFKQTASANAQSLEAVRTHLQDAQKALTGTVDALTKGVSGYSGQIAELHTKMDQHLAAAVNQLGGSITNLEEVLDEFIDALPGKR